MKRELGITVSIGVSWNKIFAKLGSDYKKPDAITVISRGNYQDLVWPLPAGDLLYVGPATQRKLYMYGIDRIGQLAQADPPILKGILGKLGLVLSLFARGADRTPVGHEGDETIVKSIGNSTTTPRDLVTDEDVAIVFYVLAESVAARLRESDFLCRVVEISLRDNKLSSLTRQKTLAVPTDITGELVQAALDLFHRHYAWQRPLRSIGLRACSLIGNHCAVQLDLFQDQVLREKWGRMDRTVDTIRRRFGYHAIERGIMHNDKMLSALDAKSDNIIHPHGYMEKGNHTGG
jgi:DNA polymerase-4